MSSIKAVAILNQIASLMMDLRKELIGMGATTTSVDSMASAFLMSQLSTLNAAAAAPATLAVAPAVAAAAASSPKAAKPKAAPKPKNTPIETILTEEQLKEMLAKGVKAQAHTGNLAKSWFSPGMFNVPHEKHQAARDQWVAFAKANGVEPVRVAKSGGSQPVSAAASAAGSAPSSPVAAPQPSPVPAVASVPVPAAAPAPTPAANKELLTKARLNQLKSYGVFADSELDDLVSWFGAWKVPTDKFAQAFLEWRQWAAANDVPSKPQRDEDGDTVTGDDDGEELNINLE